MTQPPHAPLPHCRKDAALHDFANALKVLLLGRTGDLMLQLVAGIKMIGDRPLASAGDKGTVAHAGLYGLLYPVLHQRLIHNGQHFLGHAFCRREKPRTVTRHGK